MVEDKKTYALKITGCSDASYWYSGMIGETVPYQGMLGDDGYRSREPAGYTNVVRFEDAELVEVP